MVPKRFAPLFALLCACSASAANQSEDGAPKGPQATPTETQAVTLPTALPSASAAAAGPIESSAPSATASASSVAAVPPRADGIDQLVLRFQDASVPPPYHRSYTITVTPSSIVKVVDSYGTIVSEAKARFQAADFNRLVDGLLKLKVKSGSAASDGCSGGTGRSVKLLAGSKLVLESSSSNCGGKSQGPFAAAEKWVGEVEAVAPGGLGPQ
jgi:hypothetical protein